MSYALIDTTDLTSLGNAIRTKTGGSSNLTVSEMATAVSGISGGQTIETLPSDFLNLNGDLSDCFSGVYGAKMASRIASLNITTSNVTNIYRFFNNIYTQTPADLSHITLNFYSNANGYYSTGYNASYAFNGSTTLLYTPVFSFNVENNIRGYIGNAAYMFYGCQQLLSVDSFMNNAEFLQNDSTAYRNHMFNGCKNLASIPHLEKLKTTGSYRQQLYYWGLTDCWSLNEALNLPVSNVTLTSNSFGSFVNNCYTLGRLTFETNNGQPITANWKAQTLDLTQNVGYGGWLAPNSQGYVTDATSYENYKNGVYNTTSLAYSRYNHTSAVETINSLPDCSGSGGTNTIKFKNGSGASTDGGDVANLTSDEIAVATAKGWNVQIV